MTEQNQPQGEASRDRKGSSIWTGVLAAAAGIITVKVLGLLPGFAALGLYFWLKPKYGAAMAVVAAAAGGAVLAFILWGLVRP